MNSLLGVLALILGVDVSHGLPGQTEIPSIVAVINVFLACALKVAFYGFSLNLTVI